MGMANSGISSRLPGPKKIGNTAAAQGGMAMILAHVLAIMPATLALGGCARRHVNGHIFASASACHACLRCDEYQPQVVSQRIKKIEIVASSAYLHPGCKGGSNLSGGTYLFQLSLHIRAQFAQTGPPAYQRVFVVLRGERVP